MADKPTIMLLGATGQVGFELQRSLAPFGPLLSPSRAELDLTDRDAINRALHAGRPGLIVNAAAFTAVDAAEDQPNEAAALNTDLPAILADYAAREAIPLIHYSTDYVYAGTGTMPWREDDPMEPASVYGQTKAAGDRAIQASGAEHLVFRTSWVYSARGRNFLKTLLRLAGERSTLQVVNDQIGAPTPARLIAEVTAQAIDPRTYRFRIDAGVYHLAPRGETSWHGFARAIVHEAIRSGFPSTLQPDAIAPISTAEWPTPAARPLNSRLSLDRLQTALGLALPHWESQLELTLAEVTGP